MILSCIRNSMGCCCNRWALHDDQQATVVPMRSNKLTMPM